MIPIAFKIIAHGSYEYKKCVSLREDILRKPLGLSYTSEELDCEKDHIHIAGFLSVTLCVTAFLVQEEKRLRIKQVAVRKDLQGQGIASAMMKFCEEYAQENGFKEIYCHARQTAVPFYEKNAYIPEGEIFLEITLPHRRMRKILS